MEEDQAVKFIERMFSHAARDRIAVLAVPRSGGMADRYLRLAQSRAPRRHPDSVSV